MIHCLKYLVDRMSRHSLPETPEMMYPLRMHAMITISSVAPNELPLVEGLYRDCGYRSGVSEADVTLAAWEKVCCRLNEIPTPVR